MKIQPRQIENFIKAPDKQARVILIYGPEPGLIKERKKELGRSIVTDINDPFNAISITADHLAEDPARLPDEAHALSMMGGARLIIIEDGSDKITKIVKDYLEKPSPDNLVLIEAGDLKPKSSLRSLCEKSENAAAIPCYVEEDYNIANLIRQNLKDYNFTIEQNALSWLASNLAGNRLRVRSEIDKLATYMGKPGQQITIEDALACCGDAGTETLEKLVYSIAGGQPEISQRCFRRLMAEGVSLIAILRALQNHFRRLHYIKARTQKGEALPDAMKTLTPPIFFKQADAFKKQAQKWDIYLLEDSLQKLAGLESDCKKTGTPDMTLCGQALLSLSHRAPR